MRDRDPEFRVRAEVTRLSDVRLKIGAESLSRYDALRKQGRNDVEARNVAVAWTAQRFPQYSRDVIRRCLDEAINPPKARRARGVLTPDDHWTLPT